MRHTRTRGVDSNFSQGGLQVSPGDGSQPFFCKFQWGQLQFLVASMVKMKKKSRAVGEALSLLMGAYVYDLSKLITIVNEILSDFPIYKMDTV